MWDRRGAGKPSLPSGKGFDEDNDPPMHLDVDTMEFRPSDAKQTKKHPL